MQPREELFEFVSLLFHFLCCVCVFFFCFGFFWLFPRLQNTQDKAILRDIRSKDILPSSIVTKKKRFFFSFFYSLFFSFFLAPQYPPQQPGFVCRDFVCLFLLSLIHWQDIVRRKNRFFLFGFLVFSSLRHTAPQQGKFCSLLLCFLLTHVPCFFFERLSYVNFVFFVDMKIMVFLCLLAPQQYPPGQYGAPQGFVFIMYGLCLFLFLFWCFRPLRFVHSSSFWCFSSNDFMLKKGAPQGLNFELVFWFNFDSVIRLPSYVLLFGSCFSCWTWFFLPAQQGKKIRICICFNLTAGKKKDIVSFVYLWTSYVEANALEKPLNKAIALLRHLIMELLLRCSMHSSQVICAFSFWLICLFAENLVKDIVRYVWCCCLWPFCSSFVLNSPAAAFCWPAAVCKCPCGHGWRSADGGCWRRAGSVDGRSSNQCLLWTYNRYLHAWTTASRQSGSPRMESCNGCCKVIDFFVVFGCTLCKNLYRRLRSAMRGLGTDNSDVIHIICNRDRDHLQYVRLEYRNQFGRHLVEDLKSETSFFFKDVITGYWKQTVCFCCSF